MPETKQERAERQAIMNKKMGRDLSPENLALIAKQYTSRQVFSKTDYSAYSTARRLRILDEICEHMLLGTSVNFPQFALYEIVSSLFSEDTVRFNDRTIIRPLEIDVYVKNARIGFEYDGSTFHQNAAKDVTKDKICEEAGIKLFRIKEENKLNPVPSIIQQLQNHGFGVSGIDPQLIINSCITKMQSVDYFKEVISRYISFAEFKKQEPRIYRLIKLNPDLWELTDALQNAHRRHSDSKLLAFLRAAKTKKDIQTRPDLYQAILKNKELKEIYKKLPRANANKKGA